MTLASRFTNVLGRLSKGTKSHSGTTRLLATITASVKKHLVALEGLHFEPKMQDPKTIPDVFRGVQSLLWEMFTFLDQPIVQTESLQDWVMSWVVTVDQTPVIDTQRAKARLIRLAQNLGRDYEQWLVTARTLDVLDDDLMDQLVDVPSFYEDLLKECRLKCSDETDQSILCQVCRGTDAGKLLGAISLTETPVCSVATCAQFGTPCPEHAVLQDNLLVIAIKEIIVTVGYYAVLTAADRAQFDTLVNRMDTTTSIYMEGSFCETCTRPYACTDIRRPLHARICRTDILTTELFADTKKKELFYIGYNFLTNTNWSTSTFLRRLADSLSTRFLTHTSLVDTLVRLADIVIDRSPITWDALSDIYQILSTIGESNLATHKSVITQLNTVISGYGIKLHI